MWAIGTRFSQTFTVVVTISSVFSAVKSVLVVSTVVTTVVGGWGWVVSGGGVVSVVWGGIRSSVVWSGSRWIGSYSRIGTVGIVGASLWANTSWVQGSWYTTSQRAIVGSSGERHKESEYGLKKNRFELNKSILSTVDDDGDDALYNSSIVNTTL